MQNAVVENIIPSKTKQRLRKRIWVLSTSFFKASDGLAMAIVQRAYSSSFLWPGFFPVVADMVPGPKVAEMQEVRTRGCMEQSMRRFRSNQECRYVGSLGKGETDQWAHLLPPSPSNAVFTTTPPSYPILPGGSLLPPPHRILGPRSSATAAAQPPP